MKQSLTLRCGTGRTTLEFKVEDDGTRLELLCTDWNDQSSAVSLWVDIEFGALAASVIEYLAIMEPILLADGELKADLNLPGFEIAPYIGNIHTRNKCWVRVSAENQSLNVRAVMQLDVSMIDAFVEEFQSE